MENNTDFMTDIQAANWLNNSVHTLRQWRMKRKGPNYHKLGRSVRYAAIDLKEFAKKRRIITDD